MHCGILVPPFSPLYPSLSVLARRGAPSRGWAGLGRGPLLFAEADRRSVVGPGSHTPATAGSSLGVLMDIRGVSRFPPGG
ncbi:hypothetical protein PUNSTDRAFT_54815 [Punctularia strigosozonata HHB-11173 SS5]|uniref:uncharacterized protein n=1 Tax=Punctularia strigosozonata (strain HHB-11173) TaxID=741275 RepID=UPI0004416EAC|nr:uncharacterized protein PUNSTDRAFT_54815 [Punctularia strigosozonata HHB-11173 SS5]EIN05402.1 hypothetical protein PUNSTDRAFT_54815 [Punctularia strigosozonata HHB-11173 SS5]